MPDMMYRLGQQGGDQVKAKIREIGDEGEAVEARLAQAAARKAAQVEQIEGRLAQARAQADQIRDRQAGFTAGGAAGLAEIEQRQRQEALGAQMAREYAAGLAVENAELARQRSEATQLLSAIDPLFAAQMRYGTAVANLDRLKAAGVLSEANYQRLLLSERTILDEATLAQGRHVVGARGSSIAQMELMHIVRGSADSFAAGMPPMMIFTQHLGMLAQAASYGGEQMGAFGRFMGSWQGMVVAAGVTLLATLIPRLAETRSELQRATDDLAENARKADINRQAQEAYGRTLPGITAAIRAETEALDSQNRSMALNAQLALNQARQRRTSLEITQSGLPLDIERAQRDLNAARANEGMLNAQAMAQMPAGAQTTIRPGTDAVQEAERNLRELQRQLAEVTADIAASDRLIAGHAFALADALSTAEERVKATFEGRRGRMVDQAAREHWSQPRVFEAEAALNAERDRALQVARAQEAAERRLNDTRDTGRRVTVAQARAIVEGIGGHVNSGLRPTWIRDERPGGPMSQERLYNLYRAGRGNLAAAPGHSAHESGRALDVAPGAGINNATIREAFRRQGVTAQSFWENDHFHVTFNGPARASGEAHAETLARENAARTVNIAGLLAEADAYLRSSDAGARATAQREGLTAATRQGTDTDARARQQLDQNIAQAAVSGAQHVAQLRDETAARHAVIAQVAAGTLAATDMKQAMDDEAALRPLLVLQAQAHGNALETLTRVITAYRAALHDAHEEEAHSDALAAIARLRADNDNARVMLGFTGNDAQRQIFAARRAAEREAAERHYTGDDATRFVGQRVYGARLEQDQRAADQFRQMNEQAADRAALLRTELGLGMIGEQQRQRTLAIEEQRLRLQREFGPEHQAEIEQVLDKVRAEQELQAQVERVRDAQRELQQVGGNVIDDLLNIDNLNNWGAAWKRVLHMILQEMITLAAINPLKNMLLGEKNPTLSSILGLFSHVAGALGGKGADPGVAHELAHFAAGTDSAPGGLALVGELGPEIANLPRGTAITPAAETRRLLAANDRAMGTINLTFNNDFRGADPAAVARIEADQRRMEAELPARVVAAYRDAKQRNVI